MTGNEGCPPHAPQVLFCLPDPQRCAQRLLSAERSSLAAARGPAPAAALARYLLLLGALTGVHAADRADFLRRLAAEREAAGASSPPAPTGQSLRTCGAEAGLADTGGCACTHDQLQHTVCDVCWQSCRLWGGL
jgi:hypothetical protein